MSKREESDVVRVLRRALKIQKEYEFGVVSNSIDMACEQYFGIGAFMTWTQAYDADTISMSKSDRLAALDHAIAYAIREGM